MIEARVIKCNTCAYIFWCKKSTVTLNSKSSSTEHLSIL